MNAKKTLKGIFSLDHNIKLYIPSTVEANKQARDLQAVKVQETLSLFSKLFGGATSYDAKGAWLSDTKGLIVEGVVIVESYATTQAVDEGLESVLAYATRLKADMSQEAISLEYDNKLYFI